MENSKTDINSKLNGSLNDFRNKVEAGENYIEKMSHNAGEKLGEMTSNFKDSANDYVKTGRTYIQENPAKGVAIAIAAGVVAGSIISLAMRRRHH